MEAGINSAIQAFQTNYTDSVTVNIEFINDPTTDLGSNVTYYGTYSYQQYITALWSRATSPNDTLALSHLQIATNDPVIGGNQILLNLTQARMMGLAPTNAYGSNNLDSIISLNMPVMNLTRPPRNSNYYDLVSVVEHEIDEVLGTPSSLPETSIISPPDLFRYNDNFDGNLKRVFTLIPVDAYFSVDGTNLWARYNTDPRGDYGDWWSANDIFWAPPGVTPGPQVQDAFGDPGTIQDMATNEMAVLDVIGYTLAVYSRPAPAISIVRSAAGSFTLSWSPNAAGFLLQESTNLLSGSWVASATGSNNPASITMTATQKFYRLSAGATPAAIPAIALASQPQTPVSFKLRSHILHRRQP